MEYDYENPDELPIEYRVSEPAITLPTLVMMWDWRVYFLNALFEMRIHPKRPRNLYEEPTTAFGEHLRSELLPKWEDANKVAQDKEITRVACLAPKDAHKLTKRKLVLRTWYMGGRFNWSTEDGQSPFPRDLASSVDGESKLIDCWNATKGFLKKWDLDGYETKDGKVADVPWIRQVVCLTLDAWTNQSTQEGRGAYYLPYRVAAVLESARGYYFQQTPRLLARTRDVFDLESRDTLKHYDKCRDFYYSSDELHITIPRFYPFKSDSGWKRKAKALITEKLNRHRLEQMRVAEEIGAIASVRSKRAFSHFPLFARYQVLGLNSRMAPTEEDCPQGEYAVKYAIQSASEHIGLPIRK